MKIIWLSLYKQYAVKTSVKLNEIDYILNRYNYSYI